MKKFTYRPQGTCSQLMEFVIENNKIVDVEIIGGCAGNLKGISNIIKNKTLSEVIEAFQGVPCGFKGTSCPDQIARALLEYQAQQK
ncbi:MAG: TIGR03905 family TSCPD domain-containing protein [Bacilli bacterium]|nr:TIGR03905 family TSCPD domain-containing protein [Bacilli bacterium]